MRAESILSMISSPSRHEFLLQECEDRQDCRSSHVAAPWTPVPGRTSCGRSAAARRFGCRRGRPVHASKAFTEFLREVCPEGHNQGPRPAVTCARAATTRCMRVCMEADILYA